MEIINNRVYTCVLNGLASATFVFLLFYVATFFPEVNILKNTVPMCQLLCFVVCLKIFVEHVFGHCDDITWKLKVVNVAVCVSLVATATVVFHIVAVLFGAALTECVTETFHLACLLTCTTVIPCCVTLGPSMDAWHRVFAKSSPENTWEYIVRATTLCSILGTWLGAFPIPLDWDRPWQVWPISCVIGTVLGYIAGLLIGHIQVALENSRQKKLKIV